MLRRLLVSIVLLALTVALVPAADAGAVTARTVTSESHIVRFNGVGKLQIGMRASKLRTLGYRGETLYNGCRQYTRPNGNLYLIVNRKSRLVSISVDRTYRTKAGIREGSTLRKLKRAYRHDHIEYHLDHSFGQGSNGVLVSRKGHWLSFGIDTSTQRVTSIKIATRKFALYDEPAC